MNQAEIQALVDAAVAKDKRKLVYRFPVINQADLTSITSELGVGWEVLPRSPGLDLNQAGGSAAYSTCEVCTFLYGSRGYLNNTYFEEAGAPNSGQYAYRYHLKANYIRTDTMINADANTFVGISHGSLNSQPWPATWVNGPVTQLRMRLNTTGPPLMAQLAYGAGAGGGFTVLDLGLVSASHSQFGVHFELIIDYPARTVTGIINKGQYTGTLPMTGWTSASPRGNSLGVQGQMHVFCTCGANPSFEGWYNTFSEIEMEIDLK